MWFPFLSYKGNNPDGTLGPLNPTVNVTFDLLSTLYKEIASVFPDDYVHMGGDEVSFDCWKSNPAIQVRYAAVLFVVCCCGAK